MKKMNNIVIVALCVAILGVLLMGCGKISSNNKKDTKNENTAFSEVLEAEELEAEQPEAVKDEIVLKCEEIEKEIIEEYGDFEMFSTSELTGEMLENRMNGDKVIVMTLLLSKYRKREIRRKSRIFFLINKQK